MIQFPRRSVTRFFIPLIDVLTLLFCIFLLMPMIKETGEAQESNSLSCPDSGNPRLASPHQFAGHPGQSSASYKKGHCRCEARR